MFSFWFFGLLQPPCARGPLHRLCPLHIHAPHAPHRDIKPRNIFLNQQKIAKLGDFGLARVLHEDSMACTFCGSPYYMSPEQTADSPYNEKTDIWSLGCVTYELAALRSLNPPGSKRSR